MDLSGKDTEIDNLKAPFTGVIKRIYSNTNAVWLESLNKVKYADGTVDYMTVLTMHDNDVSNLRVGQIINQGSVYLEYLDLLESEISIINPKVIILFDNQVSSIVLNDKISVSKVRKQEFIKTIKKNKYKCYAVYYLVGNGIFNI